MLGFKLREQQDEKGTWKNWCQIEVKEQENKSTSGRLIGCMQRSQIWLRWWLQSIYQLAREIGTQK